jgi:DNA-binding MarR family transcriptional regulator
LEIDLANKAQDAGDDAERIVSALLTASRVLVGVAAQSIAGLDDTITLPQFRTLVVLDSHGETKLNTLADALDVKASSALRMIDRLLVVNLVTRRENPANRREVLLALTPEGAAIVRRVTARRKRALSRIVARMSDEARDGLIQALSAFSDAAGEPGAHKNASLAMGW